MDFGKPVSLKRKTKINSVYVYVLFSRVSEGNAVVLQMEIWWPLFETRRVK